MLTANPLSMAPVPDTECERLEMGFGQGLNPKSLEAPGSSTPSSEAPTRFGSLVSMASCTTEMTSLSLHLLVRLSHGHACMHACDSSCMLLYSRRVRQTQRERERERARERERDWERERERAREREREHQNL